MVPGEVLLSVRPFPLRPPFYLHTVNASFFRFSRGNCGVFGHPRPCRKTPMEWIRLGIRTHTPWMM